MFSFNSGSGHEVWGNCNAPKAVTLSALIYCLRCMVGYDVPLNQVQFNYDIYLSHLVKNSSYED